MGYDTAYDDSRSDAQDVLADAKRNGHPASMSMSMAVIGIGHAILALAEAVKHNADRRQ